VTAIAYVISSLNSWTNSGWAIAKYKQALEAESTQKKIFNYIHRMQQNSAVLVSSKVCQISKISDNRI
jgi:hypothetical protein